MSSAVERFDDSARRRVGAYGRTVVRENELVRHPVYTRVLHWSVAIFFIQSSHTPESGVTSPSTAAQYTLRTSCFWN